MVSCQVILGTFFMSILGIRRTRHPAAEALADDEDGGAGAASEGRGAAEGRRAGHEGIDEPSRGGGAAGAGRASPRSQPGAQLAPKTESNRASSRLGWYLASRPGSRSALDHSRG